MASERQAMNDLAAAGVTSVRSAADSPAGMRGYITLHNRGELILRTSVNIRINPNMPAADLEKMLKDTPASSGLGDDMLSIWGIKMVADGGSDLAFLRKDYVNRPGFRGQPGGTQENFINACRLCNKYGWRVGIHCVGDAAVDMVLNAYEAANKDEPIAGKALGHRARLHSAPGANGQAQADLASSCTCRPGIFTICAGISCKITDRNTPRCRIPTAN